MRDISQNYCFIRVECAGVSANNENFYESGDDDEIKCIKKDVLQKEFDAYEMRDRIREKCTPMTRPTHPNCGNARTIACI